MPALFVTATGTDIGKTYVTTGLIRSLRKSGRRIEAIKPIVSGFDPQNNMESDPYLLLDALNIAPDAESLARISPWRFKAPLSPDMAARYEKRCIDFEHVADYCRNAVHAAEELLLIEGIGGIMVPLDDRHTFLDLMTEVKLPLLLVAGSYLGTISHVLSTLDVLLRRGLPPLAIIINETPGSCVPMEATRETLANFCQDIPLVLLSRYVSVAAASSAFDQLTSLILSRLPE
jgi:dethiobiotin synthetase